MSACAVALLLALDVPGSVSAEHHDLQRDATAAALRSAPVLRAAVEAGIEVNALPIVTPAEPGVAEWYRAHVTGPAGGFAIEATPEGFAHAIRSKLATEVAAR